jgi:hypothetical protein
MNIPQSNMNGPLELNITLDKTDPVTCKCGNDVFIPGLMFRKVSKFLTGSGKDGIIPIEIYCCSKCNEPLEDTLPPALKTPKIEK